MYFVYPFRQGQDKEDFHVVLVFLLFQYLVPFPVKFEFKLLTMIIHYINYHIIVMLKISFVSVLLGIYMMLMK